MRNQTRMNPKGQTLVLFAIGLLALLAVSALVIDGGNMYLSRRVAQAAADAGALAGAYEKCSGGGDPIATAKQYAKENGATGDPTVNIVDGEIQVETTVEQKSFFAQLLGFDQISAPATAAAGCYQPNIQDSVLPIAWTCKPPDLSHSDSEDCQIQSLNWGTEMQPLIYGSASPLIIDGEPGPINNTPFDFNKDYLVNHIYVVMDTGKEDEDLAKVCAPPFGTGNMNCDIDNDGVFDIIGGGDRSWLQLDYDVNNINKFISGDKKANLAIHTWLSGKKGGNNSAFGTLIKRIENCLNDINTNTNTERDACHLFVLPVYNAFCTGKDDPYSSDCQNKAHSSFPLELGHYDLPQGFNFVQASTYFHIIGFSEFYVTCIDKNGSGNVCPGEKAMGVSKEKTVKSAIEGYFVSGAPADPGSGGSGGADLGVYIRSLTK